MTVSLMNMLGGQTNLTAALSEKEGALNADALASNHDDAFEMILSASGLKEISAKELRDFFASQGIDVDVLEHGFDGVEFPALNIGEGQKLPSEIALIVQEVVAKISAPASKQEVQEELIAQLPERELTAEELSEIVQATGLSPQVIFDALRQTPAASPNLAAAMVEDMGELARDAGLPLPKQGAQVPSTESVEDPVSGQPMADASAPEGKLALTDNQQQVVQKIVNVLQGVSEQAEFPGEWLARLAALANKHIETKKAGEQPQVLTSAPIATLKAAGNDNRQYAAPQVVATEAKPAVANPAANATVANPDVQVTANRQPTQPVVQGEVDAPKPLSQPLVQVGGQTQQFSAGDTSASQVATVVTTPANTQNISAESAKFAPVQSHQSEETPSEQVAVRFRQAVSTGETSMEIKLKPVELGRVDVKIETAADGTARIHVSAERRDTLDMLQRDARALERALQDLGFKTDNSSLSFNMRGDEQQRHASGQTGDEQQGSGRFSLDGGYADDENHDDVPLAYDVSRAYSLTLDRGVDISV